MKSNNSFKHNIEKKNSEQSLYSTWHVKQIKTRVAIYSLHNWHDMNTVFPVIRNCWLLFSIYSGIRVVMFVHVILCNKRYSFNENCSLNEITKGKNLFFSNSLHVGLLYFYSLFLYIYGNTMFVVWRICFVVHIPHICIPKLMYNTIPW